MIARSRRRGPWLRLSVDAGAAGGRMWPGLSSTAECTLWKWTV